MNFLISILKNLIINLDQADNHMLIFQRTIKTNINNYSQAIGIKIKIFLNIKLPKILINRRIHRVMCFSVKNIIISIVSFNLLDEININAISNI